MQNFCGFLMCSISKMYYFGYIIAAPNSHIKLRTPDRLLVGAAGDAVIGAIGGAAGAGGYLYGKHKESEQRAYQQGYNAGRRAK
jgi:hypothetical protein